VNDVPQVDFPSFVPHPLLRGANRMTFFGAAPRPGLAEFAARGERQLVPVDESTRVRVMIDRPSSAVERRGTGLVILHGLAGSSESSYTVGTARNAVRSGFVVARLNARNCGGTVELTSEPYHGAETADLAAAARHLVESGEVERVHLVGFSIGGNQALRLAAEWGDEPPSWITGVSTVSPCIDFAAAARTLEHGFLNRVMQRRFVGMLKDYVRERSRLDPAFTLDGLGSIHTVRQFDERYTAPLSGYADADDYYARASMKGRLHEVRVPTLILASRDDPLVPVQGFETADLSGSGVRLVVTERGGHVAFVGASKAVKGDRRDLDRRWAENRVVEFARLCDRA